jgi:hypothetical protein
MNNLWVKGLSIPVAYGAYYMCQQSAKGYSPEWQRKNDNGTAQGAYDIAMADTFNDSANPDMDKLSTRFQIHQWQIGNMIDNVRIPVQGFWKDVVQRNWIPLSIAGVAVSAGWHQELGQIGRYTLNKLFGHPPNWQAIGNGVVRAGKFGVDTAFRTVDVLTYPLGRDIRDWRRILGGLSLYGTCAVLIAKFLNRDLQQTANFLENFSTEEK